VNLKNRIKGISRAGCQSALPSVTSRHHSQVFEALWEACDRANPSSLTFVSYGFGAQISLYHRLVFLNVTMTQSLAFSNSSRTVAES
jgi:hypothetical protein